MAEVPRDTIRYPSGRVAVMINVIRGNKYFYFYDLNNQGSLLANFIDTGGGCEGFVQYPSGKQRCIINTRGGMLCDASGNPQKEWSWYLHGKKAGLKAPIEIKLNNNMRFTCTDEHHIKVTVKVSGREEVFNVAKVPLEGENFSEMMMSRHKTGKLGASMTEILGKTVPTLRARQKKAAVNPGVVAVKNAQKHGWNLPRISASGRETKSFCENLTLDGLDATVRGCDNLSGTLKGFRTSIGKNVDSAQYKPSDMGKTKAPEASVNSQICRAVVKKPKPKVPPLLPISMKKVAHIVSTATAGQVVVVLCSTRHDENCKAAEKMMAGIANRYLKKARRDAAERAFQPAAPAEEGGGG
jgi:hypothetical protein